MPADPSRWDVEFVTRPSQDVDQSAELPSGNLLLTEVTDTHDEKMTARVVVGAGVSLRPCRSGSVDVAVPVDEDVIRDVGPTFVEMSLLHAAEPGGSFTVASQLKPTVMDREPMDAVVYVMPMARLRSPRSSADGIDIAFLTRVCSARDQR
jgi:hypothetical protein